MKSMITFISTISFYFLVFSLGAQNEKNNQEQLHHDSDNIGPLSNMEKGLNINRATNRSSTFIPLLVEGDNESTRLKGINPYISFFDPSDTYRGFLWQGPGNNMSLGTASGSSGNVQFYNNNVLNMTIQQSGGLDIFGSSPTFNMTDGAGTQIGTLYKSGDDLEIAAFRSGTFGTPGDLILQTTILPGTFTIGKYAGNVGIGTRTPATKLHIASSSEVLRLEGTGYTFMSFYNGADYKGFLLSDQNNIGLGTSAANTTGAMWFYVNNAIRMWVSPNGNVGIGTQNPTHKLAVNGTIRTKEVIVDTGWADYVFDPQYVLPDLHALELFIKENKHLPGIPSARQIENEGLSVGDMQKRMMEKIEELSLYVIALNKEIEILKSTTK